MASTCFRAAARVASAAGRSAAASRSAPSAARVAAAAARRASCFSRVPVELGCCAGLSLLPLHSAVAAARLTSRLSTASSCRALSQGILCRTYPGHIMKMMVRETFAQCLKVGAWMFGNDAHACYRGNHI